MSRSTVPTYGWVRAIAEPDHRGQRTGNLIAKTDAGHQATISANVKVTGANVGLRHVHLRNPGPPKSWTSIEIDAHGAVLGIATARTRGAAAKLVAAGRTT